MPQRVVLISVPALREQDLGRMPVLAEMAAGGSRARLTPGFPAVTCPVQADMTTGVRANRHGVVGNGFFYRDHGEFEMWTAWNECIQAPQIWDVLHERRPGTTSAVWFPLHSKGCGADYICTPAPIHNPDGSESLWCYTRPEPLYAELIEELDHFPLHHFWGPLANISSSEWIIDSAVRAAGRYRPDFFYIYLPHLDYSPQKFGPDDEMSHIATTQLDEALGRLRDGFTGAYDEEPLWLVASEYVIGAVDHIAYPNRVLREAGLLAITREEQGGEILDVANSPAWALTDHQLSHVFVKDGDPQVIERAAALFRGAEGIAEVLVGAEKARYALDHARSGDVVLVSAADSWQAYYYWKDDAQAPSFARTVDIHRKPGYDPCEMHIDQAAGGIALDAALVRGSHGAPSKEEWQRGMIVASQPGVLAGSTLEVVDVFSTVLRQFGL